MKKTITLILMILFVQILISQDLNECKKIVDLTIESIDKKTSEPLHSYLSEDFTIAGQEGEVAKMVLGQLFSQLGETVISHQEKQQNLKDNKLELTYLFEYQEMGQKEATFLFNHDNLLQELTLFKMEVKKMCNESEVTKNSNSIIEIPFEMAGNLIMVDVHLDGVKRKFLLDTGAPKVILNSQYLTSQDSTKKSISSTKGVSGNISGMDIEHVDKLDFGGIQLINQDVLCVDLSHLKAELNHSFYGLIGYELIKDYDLFFNYEEKLLTLIDPNYYDEYMSENFVENKLDVFPIEIQGHIPIIKANIGNEELKLGIDSGAEVNLIDLTWFSNLKKYTREIKTEDLVGADNNPIKVQEGKIENMNIGQKSFEYLETIFSDISHLNKNYKTNIDGLIGYPVLSKQKTIISFARQEIIFIE